VQDAAVHQMFQGQREHGYYFKLTVGQFREALQMDKPVVRISAKQCKIKFEHYRPLHPGVIAAVRPHIEGRGDNECMFSYASFANFVRKDRNKILLSRINRLFVIDDLRKFTGQYGNVISWEQSNRSYISTHGVLGVEWSHYRHPLPEHVYEVYIRNWKDVVLAPNGSQF